MTAPPREQEEERREHDAEAALRAFFGIAALWELSTDEQIKLLGSPPRSTFFKWKKEGGALSNDTVERLSHILNIHKCLQILFTDDGASDGWIRRPNQAPFLNGISAIDYMTETGHVADVFKVRSYLDAQRGG
ncbi:antitoxin Xre-like helix-turn-helix domain-containing protein [Bradyrhizobium genomosp. I (2014)]|uniref:antitoxin Xre-like helix-turn-helix domain-containing protein n=1 Tax=Bradyrhizobium genomosp. I (2014) TaxID=2683269 RepID=UPI00068659F1|nr:antitoxin Xre-like helix-turn-helix domain-containing protein [Bradyrhizobium sp. CCBAU 43298]